MGYDDNTCVKQLKGAGLTPVCVGLIQSLPHHCDDIAAQSATYHAICHGQDAYNPIQVTACIRSENGQPVEYRYFKPGDIIQGCSDLHRQDPQWELGFCYCCCSCMAYGTKVAVPGGFKSIEQIARGEEVITGAVNRNAGNLAFDWSPTTVTFSDGAAGGQSTMVYLSYGDGDRSGDLICTMDQVLMLASGKVTTAGRLQVGDLLVDKDGNPVTLQSVAVGHFSGGIHHIGIHNAEKAELDGHLLIAGGLVAGDYFLQLYFDDLPDDIKVDDHDQRPELGSHEYEHRHSHLKHDASVLFGAVPDQGGHRLERQTGRFTMFSRQREGLGGDVAALFTEDQTHDLMENGQHLSLSNPIPKALVNNLFQTLAGFYPDTDFYLDWYRSEPNVYAIERWGRKTVLVTGGLARMVDFGYEGMAMAIAHGIARFSDVTPRGAHGFAGTGAADLYAFGVISRNVWWGNSWIKSVVPAFNQMEALCKLITEAHAAGNPSDRINEPSIACRLQAMQAGVAGGGVPECAGGEPAPKISLTKVTARNHNELLLTLSVAPTPETAENPANYVIEPAAKITGVRRAKLSDFMIHLTVQLQPETTYTVTIQNLESILGSDVDPKHCTATVEVK